MTARSDDEIRADIFRLSWGRRQAETDDLTDEAVLRLADDVPELLDSRERAIRWAVTLEGQLAAVAAIVTELDEGMTVGVIRQALADRLRAALTGSTE